MGNCRFQIRIGMQTLKGNKFAILLLFFVSKFLEYGGRMGGRVAIRKVPPLLDAIYSMVRNMSSGMGKYLRRGTRPTSGGREAGRGLRENQ